MPDTNTPKPLFVPPGGMKIKGVPYQGGEKIPSDVLDSLSPYGQRMLRSGGVHADPARAKSDLRRRPTLTKDAQKAGRTQPKVGRAVKPPYADPRLPPKPGLTNKAQRVKSAEEGRRLLPGELIDSGLITDEEAANLSEQQAKSLVKHFNSLPPDLEYVAAAKAGRAKRGWYEQAGKTLSSLFGAEAPRFVALLAATSPRVDVAANMHKAATIWARYQKWLNERQAAGIASPPTYEEVRRLLAKWRGQFASYQKLKSHEPNIALALTAEDPGKGIGQILSGPKVDSFRRNLLGDLFAVTNDAWMSAMGGFDQKELAGSHKKAEGRSVATFNGAYLANNAKIRRVANKLNAGLNPGEKPWTPAEVQETVWSVFRALAYIGGHNRYDKQLTPQPLDPIQALNSLTHETVAGNVDFVTLLLKPRPDGTENPVVQNLRRVGLGRAVDRLRKAHSRAARQTTQTRPQGSVTSDLSPDERSALEAVARRAGQHVSAFTHSKSRYRRIGERLRYASMTPAKTTPVTPMGPTPTAPMTSPPGGAMPGGPNLASPQPQPEDLHKQNLLAFNPNVEEGLDFEDALARVRSGNQKAFKQIIKHVNEQVGLKAKLQDAIGDWSDGAENSVLQKIDDPVDPKTVDYLAAWYGLLGNQKSVLSFTPSYNGTDSVYTIDLPETDMSAIRAALDQAGIPFRVLVPSKKGTKLVIFDQGRGLREKVAAFASNHHADIRESNGQGRLLGGDTRTAARSKFRKIITAYEASASKQGGRVPTYRPPVLPHHIRSSGGGDKSPEVSDPVRESRKGFRLRYADEKPRVKPKVWDEYHQRHSLPCQAAPYTPSRGNRVQMARGGGVRAPANGVIVRGVFYRGGQFIPSANIEKAHYGQYRHIEAQRERYLRGDFAGALEAEAEERGKMSAFERLKNRIEKKEDIPDDSARKIVAKIGRDKLGSREMAKRAAAALKRHKHHG